MLRELLLCLSVHAPGPVSHDSHQLSASCAYRVTAEPLPNTRNTLEVTEVGPYRFHDASHHRHLQQHAHILLPTHELRPICITVKTASSSRPSSSPKKSGKHRKRPSKSTSRR